jgi:hypothetical protein
MDECTVVLQKIFEEDVTCIEVREFGGGLFNKVYATTFETPKRLTKP